LTSGSAKLGAGQVQLLADLYGPSERGRVKGTVMSGASFAFIVGPSIGGWLYQIGGIRLPFLTVAAFIATIAFIAYEPPLRREAHEPVPSSRSCGFRRLKSARPRS